MGRTQLLTAAAVALCIFSATLADAELEIERYERQVNLKTQFVVAIDQIALRNTGTTPVSTFQWCTLEEHMPHLAYLSVSFEGDGAVPDWQSRLPKAVAGTPAGITCVELPTKRGGGKSLAASEQEEVSVSAVYTKLQAPFPKTVTQQDPQRVLYKGNLYVLSPHPVASQDVKFDVQGEILSYTKHKAGKKTGRTVSYGPFSDVAPLALEPVELHYINNAPFAVAKTLERTLDIAWGKIQVEERYLVTHGGAKFTGSWSRWDYQSDPGRFAQSSFRELPAEAPPSARHLYFRDAIGNVSTSAVRRSSQGVSAALLPRIPLYGGWSTDFVFGFELPLRAFSNRAADGRKEFIYSFSPHVKGLVVDEHIIKVVLPEGAYDIGVELAFEAELSFEPKYTYLNKQGRTVVVLRADNVVDALNQPFVVRYQLPPFAWVREPLLWGVSLAAILGAAVVFARSDFSLVRDGARNAARGRSQAGAVAARAAALFAERRKVLSGLETVFERPEVTPEDVLATKNHTDATLASTAEKLRDAQRKLEALAGAGKSTQLKALIEKEALSAAASAKVFARRLELLRSGKLTTDVKLEGQQREIAASRKDVATAIDALAAST